MGSFGTALLAFLAIGQPPGQVTVDLGTWGGLVQEIARLEAARPPAYPFAIAKREIRVRFERGVTTGELDLEVEAFGGGKRSTIAVPLVGGEASLAEVAIDGSRAVAVQADGHYSALVDRPGRHRVQVRFAVGREEERFSRSFLLPLPPAPITRVAIDIPEKDLLVDIDGGVVLEERTTEKGTHVEGALDSRPGLSVRWQRRLTHKSHQEREMEVESLVLASISEEMIRTKTELRFKVTSGETDRVEIAVPSGLEVTRVAGEAVLQWTTAEGALIVLLRHLVEDDVKMIVEAETPRAIGGEGAKLAFLTPKNAKLREGYVAIEGRDGFEVTVASASGGEEVGTREVPSRLAALSDKPLLFAYRHRGAFPEISLGIVRNEEIDLAQAIIDDLEASTVLVEQGVEITKLRLYVRNNTRQYLGLHLPNGAIVTHALIDGAPFHPAAAKDPDGRERLLVPLRQSEKLSDSHPRQHVVKSDETLGEISLLYFNRTDRVEDILRANPGTDGHEIQVGQRLAIPASAGGVTIEESNSIVEIAYKVACERLSPIAIHKTGLPDMDIPVMNVTWHYYFPRAYEPVRFESNLKQLTSIRYDPLRRALQFLESAAHIQGAWAGDFSTGSYKNILDSRKAIYRRELQKQVTEAFSSFPLVGDRYRFTRVLLGDRPAALEIVYLERDLIPWVQWGALFVVLVLAARFAKSALDLGVRSAISREQFWSFALALLALLALSHFVLGVHRHLLLGIDAALVFVLVARVWMAKSRSALEGEPLRPLDLSRLWRAGLIARCVLASIAIGLALTYPLLLSMFVLALALALTVRHRLRTPRDTEADHA
jgi:LysM domain-containing protein